jgi:hypothetical protein
VVIGRQFIDLIWRNGGYTALPRLVLLFRLLLIDGLRRKLNVERLLLFTTIKNVLGTKHIGTVRSTAYPCKKLGLLTRSGGGGAHRREAPEIVLHKRVDLYASGLERLLRRDVLRLLHQIVLVTVGVVVFMTRRLHHSLLHEADRLARDVRFGLLQDVSALLCA